LDKSKNSQYDVFFGGALQEVVQSHLAQLVNGEVVGEFDTSGEERERVPVERLRVKPDGIGDGEDATLDVLHVLAETQDLVLPATALPRCAQIRKVVELKH
jgi:hypothetical protein